MNITDYRQNFDTQGKKDVVLDRFNACVEMRIRNVRLVKVECDITNGMLQVTGSICKYKRDVSWLEESEYGIIKLQIHRFGVLDLRDNFQFFGNRYFEQRVCRLVG